MGVNDSVEGGASITYGTEFSKISKSTNQEVFKGKIANIFRIEEDENKKPKSNKKEGEQRANVLYIATVSKLIQLEPVQERDGT